MVAISDNINMIYCDMDTSIPEEVVLNHDDSYTIFINSRCSYSVQKKAFEHALEHIRERDWEKENVQLIEAKAHGMDVSDQLSEKEREWKERAAAYTEEFKKYHKMVIRKLNRYKRYAEKIGIQKYNEEALREYEAHKADPDW